MKSRLGGFLLILGILATASAIPVFDFDLYGGVLDLMDGWCHLWNKSPSNDINNVLFELRTNCKKLEYRVTEANKLRDLPDFDANKKTVVFVSGWRSDMDESYTEEITKAYTCRAAHNFIVVNTRGHIKHLYTQSAANTKKLGHQIAMGLQKLNIHGKDIHLIGHSLGAHIMGSAGRKYFELTKEKIGRITGLDPARPCYEGKTVYERLGVDAATFVDVIHSNAKEAGTREAIGHVDFYPGGVKSTQPSCDQHDIKCSHAMSIRYYTESIYSGNEKNFEATQCDRIADIEGNKGCRGPKTYMGYDVKENNKGIYVLNVQKSAPFGMQSRARTSRSLDTCGVCHK